MDFGDVFLARRDQFQSKQVPFLLIFMFIFGVLGGFWGIQG
jgi:hypothetical protein